jgi:hypothetical protein
MKMVKSLLLGSAAGFVAVAGAQAADLPVKAKPVEYVKVCSLYGAGFFYIPGTDTCIKIGGAVRVQAEYNTGAGGIPTGFGATMDAQGVFTRSGSNDVNFRTRIYFSVDTRQQTDYGTLRSYWRMGINETTPTDGGGASSTGTGYWDRAFIQFAGFTVGRTVSFYDAITFANFNYNNPRVFEDSGAGGITLWAYTAQFGNGISASLSAEDPNGRGKLVVNGATTNAGFNIATNVTNSNGLAANAGGNGFGFPDVVGALRVDQAWGSAQVMAAMHDASGSYYGSTDVTGHPNNAYGYAVGAGFAINLPSFGATANVNSQPNVDQLQAAVNYTKGASGYATNGNNTDTVFSGNNTVGLGWLVDGMYSAANGSNVELTTAWSAYGGYQHIWTPQWRTSVYGGYLNVTYDAAAGAILAASPAGTGWFCSPACPNLNPSFSIWQAGTRTQWNPVNQLDVGVDVLYSHLNTMNVNNGTNTIDMQTAVGGRPAGIYTLTDENVWSVMFRVQRNFWP